MIGKFFLGLFFYLVITPLGFVVRLLGKDRVHCKTGKDSYWVKRKEQPVTAHKYETMY